MNQSLSWERQVQRKHLNQFHFSKGRKISWEKGGRGRTEDDERCFGEVEEEACVLSNPLHPHNPTNANALSSEIQRQMQMKRHDLTKAATMQRRIHVPSHHAKKGAHANKSRKNNRRCKSAFGKRMQKEKEIKKRWKERKGQLIWMRTLKFRERSSTRVLVYRNQIHNRGKYFISSGPIF